MTSVLVFGLEIILLEIGVVWHCAVCAALTDSDAALLVHAKNTIIVSLG